MNTGMNPCNDCLLGRGRWRRWLRQLLLGLCIVFLCSAVSSAEVGGLTRTIVVCNGTSSTTSSSGTASSVSLESGVTYLLSGCNVVVTLLTTNTAELHDVAIVVRGGSALPAVAVSSTMVRNLTIDVADVVALSTRTTRGVFFGQVTTAENITVTMSNVQIYNAMDVSVISLAAGVLNTVQGLTVTLSNCILKNATTRGLIVVRGNQATTAISSPSITVSGGQYTLTVIGAGSVLISLSDLSSLTDAMIVVRNVSVHATVVATSDGSAVEDIDAGVIAKVAGVDMVTTTSIFVESVDVVGVIEEDLIKNRLAAIRIARISFHDSSVIVRGSRLRSQAGTPSCITVSTVRRAESVFIEMHSTLVNLVALGMSLDQSGPLRVAAAAAVVVATIDVIVNYTLAMSDCRVDISVTNSSLLQSYTGVTCASVMWNNIPSTSGLSVAIQRVKMNVMVRFASVALVLSPYAPVLGVLTVQTAAFSSSACAFQHSTIVVSNVSLFSDVVVIQPAVPPDAYPLLMAPLLAVDVTTAVVLSPSNWTTSIISVVMSRIIVRQLRFLTLPSAAVNVGSVTNCNAIYLSNTSGMTVFYNGLNEYRGTCMSAVGALIASSFPSTYSAPNVLEMVRVNVRDCDIEPAVSMLDSVTTGVRNWPQIFATTVFLPPTVTNCSVSVSNVSSVGLNSMLNGPAIALSGTHLTGFNATLNDVAGFPLGMVWSNSEAGSTIQSSSILAVSVDASGGGVVTGNVTAVAPVVVTLRNCVLSSRGSGLFGDGSTRWRTAAGGPSWSPEAENSSLPSSVFLLQGCNTWNGRPLTLPLARRLLREAQNVTFKSVTIRAEGESTANCVVTATLEFVPPLPVSRVPSTTGAVAVAAMALSAISATSTTGVTSMLRLQAMFGSLRVGRRCYQATSGGAATDDDSSSSDDVGSAVFDNPLQLAIPVKDSSLQYAAGCVIGNTVLILVAMIVLNVPSAASMVTRAGASTLAARAQQLLRHLVLETAPGHGVVALMLLLTPTVTSAIALGASKDDAPTVVVGAAGVLFYGVGPLASVGLALWCFPLRAMSCVAKRAAGRPRYAPQRLAATLRRWMFEEASQWVPYQPSKGSLNSFSQRFRHRFGVLFVGYRSGFHWYATVDVAVPVLTGVLCGLPAGSVSCSLVLYVLLAISIVACMGSVLLRPCMTRWDNLWAVVGNGFSVAVTALIVADRMDSANTAATALAWLSLVPTLASVAQLLHRVFLTMMGTTNRTDGRHVVARAVVGAQQGDGALSLSSSSLDVSLASIVASEKRIAMNESLILLVTLVCSRQQQISNV